MLNPSTKQCWASAALTALLLAIATNAAATPLEISQTDMAQTNTPRANAPLPDLSALDIPQLAEEQPDSTRLLKGWDIEMRLGAELSINDANPTRAWLDTDLAYLFSAGLGPVFHVGFG
ncbi:MAG: hypothetical protein H6707_04260 [Deltaproteobacteria bacterium]|nr:hypothetical protein [Deltaproteobacteria bacterium]